ncbi:MAG: gliding motility lipoprotein GldB, partial [Flavisolibacter sp.]|nr:gliding motility lipoprotein GldB [Flavisolibacter sp.]
GNIGQWIGWRIVQQLADKNEKLTVQQVIETPARKVFEGAGYRPK